MYVNSMLIVMEKSLPAKGFLVYKCKKKVQICWEGIWSVKLPNLPNRTKDKLSIYFICPQ